MLKGFSRRHRFALWGSVVVIIIAAMGIFIEFPSVYGIALIIGVIGLIQYFFKPTKALNANLFLALILLLSTYTVLVVSTNSENKDKEVRKILAINLANERDPVAEVIFPQMTRRMYADENIMFYLDNISTHEGDLYTHLNENYLNSYLKKYDFQITVCMSRSNIYLENTGEMLGCFSFFEDMLNEYGMRIPGTSFYHLNNQNGRISYLGMIEYVLPDGEEICIYLELDSKLSRELLGYPELLLDGNITGRSIFSKYSSAKYFDGQLIARTGNFEYPLYNTYEADSASLYTFIDNKSYNHLMYSNDGEIELFLSRPKDNLFNVTASFAWVFLFLYIVVTLWLLLGGIPVGFNFRVPSLKNRIRYSMVQLIFLSLIMVGMVTITYSVKGFESKNYDSLNEKLLSAKVDIEDDLVPQEVIHPDYTDYLTHYLIKLSNVLRSDINLYSLNGELIATSRPEVFERQLIGTDMHPLSYYELSTKYSPKLIHTEQIGKMEYLSAYAPIFNNRNQMVAYLNLPYFTRQGEFMEEVFSVIVALVNIYALLILFAIFVAIVISNQISKPLELIREKLSKVNLDKHNETISYEGNDELGQLVAEYNRMVVELAESANKLAQSQRQIAWREMAKQIAHEIKNPLTPIKLNLQYLIRAKKNNQPDWDSMFDKFSDSLIDQINTLSNIATEFSNFAKMPVGQFKHIVLNGIVNDAVSLFSAYPNIYLEKSIPAEEISIYADKEQISRVFVNLIKNAVQAIGRRDDGHLRVSVVKSEPNVRVIIEDNGMGISEDVAEKIFTPNFTTKSGGMGLGLAISKGIVEVVGGSIWFETTPGLGTKFFVQLPISTQA
jgi:signal transduction histidine kinase